MKAKRAFTSPRCAWLSGALLILLASCGSTPPAAKKADPPKILNFYANPAQIAKGEEALVCYGTESVTDVRLEPPVESLKPALTRCFNVKPDATTEYKLIATGPGGETTQSLTVTVQGVKKEAAKAGPQLIRFLVSDTKELTGPGRATLCYGLMNAKSAALTPNPGVVPVSERNCLTVAVAKTTTFKLEAKGAAGATDTESITVTVK